MSVRHKLFINAKQTTINYELPKSKDKNYPSFLLKQKIVSKWISNFAHKLDKVFCDSRCGNLMTRNS